MPPLHARLPDAYEQGTFNGLRSSLCAFTPTKTAVYALCRGRPGMDILVPLGVYHGALRVVYAVLENDCRRLLGHIISQVGYMVAAWALARTWPLTVPRHAFAHILYKGLLCTGCGTALHMTGESRFTELGGLWKKMPWAFVFTLMAACPSPPSLLQWVRQQVDDRPGRFRRAELSGVGFLLMLASAGTSPHRPESPGIHLVRKNRPRQEVLDRARKPRRI